MFGSSWWLYGRGTHGYAAAMVSGRTFGRRPQRCAAVKTQAATRALVLLGLAAFGVGPVLADPLHFGLVARVSTPDKPVLTVTADEPLQNLSIAMEPQPQDDGSPSAETAPLKTTAKKLGPGQKLQLKLGTGKAGATHWQGVISCQAGGKLWKREANFDTDVRKPLDITFDPNFHSQHLDIYKHFVEVQLSEPADRATIDVYADDGTKMGSGQVTFSGEAPGTWLRVPWRGSDGPTDSVVLRLAMKLYAKGGSDGSIDLYPWAVSVPHEEVQIASASIEVADTERSKLDESLRKINTILNRVERTLLQFAEQGIVTTAPPSPKLYVTGHTDSVGADSDNLTLSKNRAKAIAAYFRKQGFRMPIFYLGYGERQLRAKTADNVDDARNRRADYTLALEAPPAQHGLTWQKL